MILGDTLVSEQLNNLFQNATKSLNINENSSIVYSSFSTADPVDKAINTYKNNRSIVLINKNLKMWTIFHSKRFLEVKLKKNRGS